MDSRTETPSLSGPLAVERAAGQHAVKARLDRALVAVTGEERNDFLHRICSQDILGMAEGEGRPA